MAQHVAHSTPAVADRSAGARSHPVRLQHLPPLWETQLPPPSLPVGVAVLAGISAVAGLLLLLSGLLFALNYYASPLVPSGLVLLHVGDPFGASILIVLGAAVVALSSALWHQELWAFYLSVGFLFFGLAYLFFTASITLLFLVLLGVFVYLIAVRHHFY